MLALVFASALTGTGTARAQTVAAPADGASSRSSESHWQSHNRSVALFVQGMHQNYREFDNTGAVSDGILDTERGRLQGLGLVWRWQGDVSSLPLWLELGGTHLSGQTGYRGYLQSGGTLVPYQSSTGNQVQELQFKAGWPQRLNGIGLAYAY